MEQETHKNKIEAVLDKYATPLSIIIAGIIIASAMSPAQSLRISGFLGTKSTANGGRSAIEEAVLPRAGVKLPVVWGDIGARLVEAGAIDPVAFKKIYQARGPSTGESADLVAWPAATTGGTFPAEYEQLLSRRTNGALIINEDNAGYLLNLLWAFGLANKSPILETGEMMNPAYGGAGNFASTGGWTVAKGKAMDHYSKHAFVSLTPAQQELVDRVSQNIYRPCCGNATHFPDCNHGMAMLGLLELMAAQGVSEQDMYKAALAVNSYWFPGTYLTMAEYMQGKGVDWKKVSPQEMLGANYSSAAGFRNIVSQVSAPSNNGGGSGCGVEARSGAPAAPRQQSGCGI